MHHRSPCWSRVLVWVVVLAYHSLVVLGAGMRLVAPCRTDDHRHLVPHTAPDRTFEVALRHNPRPGQSGAAVALAVLVTVVRSAFSWATTEILDFHHDRHLALVENYCGNAILTYHNDHVDPDHEVVNVDGRDRDQANVCDQSGVVVDSVHSPVNRTDPDGAEVVAKLIANVSVCDDYAAMQRVANLIGVVMSSDDEKSICFCCSCGTRALQQLLPRFFHSHHCRQRRAGRHPAKSPYVCLVHDLVPCHQPF